jgi:hypothetical protein
VQACAVGAASSNLQILLLGSMLINPTYAIAISAVLDCYPREQVVMHHLFCTVFMVFSNAE